MAKDAKKDVRTRLEIAKARRTFAAARATETQYAVQLRKLAKIVADLVRKGNPDGTAESAAKIAAGLYAYGTKLDAWAGASADAMLAEVAARNRQAWLDVGVKIGTGIAEEIATAPVGSALAGLRETQVTLIKSIPKEAAERVNYMTEKGIAEGERPKSIAAKIMQTGEVSKSRATLIARTEVARTAATLTQTRAERVGSEGYIWRSAEDVSVRPSHKKMDGKFVRWDQPPTLDNMTGHAGCLPNCRCFAEVVFPEAPTTFDPIPEARQAVAGAGPVRQPRQAVASPRVAEAVEHRVQRAAKPASSAHRIAYVSPARLNQELKARDLTPGENTTTGETQFHVSPTENRPRTMAWQETLTKPDLTAFPAPELTVNGDTINVDNGRHRIAAMTRMEMRAIPTSMTPKSIRDAKKKGLIVDKPQVKAAPRTRSRKTSRQGVKTGG